jgi:hypothetical protein
LSMSIKNQAPLGRLKINEKLLVFKYGEVAFHDC